MSADLNHAIEVVEALFAAELPSGVYLVDGLPVYWRNLDDPEADSQKRTGYPLIEFEQIDQSNVRGEYGSPGYNRWEENAGIMFHVHVSRSGHSMKLARKVMKVVVDTLCGRFSDGVQFKNALPAYRDPGGDGLTRGVSRAIKYQYEYQGR